MEAQHSSSKSFIPKEVSWISFNRRVLEEAEDPSVPLMERVRFLGIYSSNLDEFSRVRVATLKRLTGLGSKYKRLNIPNPTETLAEVHRVLTGETKRFNHAYASVIRDLEEEGIHVVDERSVSKGHREHLMNYFMNKVKPRLMPILLKGNSDLSTLRDHPLYFAVEMKKRSGAGRPGYALIEIPGETLPRFHVLPKTKRKQVVMYLDDIIRFGLPMIFSSLPYDSFRAFAIKFSRDSELAFDDDFTESVLERMSEGLRGRMAGNPVRMNYDAKIPDAFLNLLRKKLKFSENDSLYPGDRYHNRKQLQDFPQLGREDLCWPPLSPLPHPQLSLQTKKGGIFKKLRSRDELLHFPYHSFNHFIDFLREAAMDPLVRTIALTQYRFAKHSCVAAALMAAVRNGKTVTVLVEPQARFDEEANLQWAAVYREAGIKVIVGLPGLKVHAKICVIERAEGGKLRAYCAIGTGNFNESTAALYTDHMLLTADPQLGKDVLSCFRYFATPTRQLKLSKLISSPSGMREMLANAIGRETELAQKGSKAEVFIKVNNLSDPKTIAMLEKAADAGVKVRLVVRSMYSISSKSKNLNGIGIVDRLLEHSRIFIFNNGGAPLYYLSSADILPRNLDSRFEIACPIENSKLQKELAKYAELQWGDEVKARVLGKEPQKRPKKFAKKARATRAQGTIRSYLEKLSGTS